MAKAPEKQSATEESAKGGGGLFGFLKYWIGIVINPFSISSDDAGQVSRFQKFFASFSGSMCPHIAIGTFYYMHNRATIEFFRNDQWLINLFSASMISTMWIIITTIILTVDNRRLTFIDVFRSAFLFNLLIYSIGKLAAIVNFQFIR